MPMSGFTSRALTNRQTQTYNQILARHASDPRTGRCPLCRVRRCPEWVFARAQLTMDGHATSSVSRGE